MKSRIKAVVGWFQGGNIWVLWAGLAVAGVIGLLLFDASRLRDERDTAREQYGAAKAANEANTATIDQMQKANAILQRAVAENHARQLEATRRYESLKAEVEHDQSPPTGCTPSLADPAPPAMLRALRGTVGVR